jgi:hypothetical protein
MKMPIFLYPIYSHHSRSAFIKYGIMQKTVEDQKTLPGFRGADGFFTTLPPPPPPPLLAFAVAFEDAVTPPSPPRLLPTTIGRFTTDRA